MRTEIINHRSSFTMSSVCKWYEHCKSGFYNHRKIVEEHNQKEEEALRLIRVIRKSGIMCGARKMKIYLMKFFDFKIGRDKLLDIMRRHNLQCQYYKQHKITSNGKKTNYPLLLDVDKITNFGEAIVTDITYIHLPNGKFCYVSIISDVRTRMILSSHVSDNLLAESSLKALKKALKQYDLMGAIHHSDHGSQYTSHDYIDYLLKNGLKISMTGEGKCFDNAQAERIFNTLKYEYSFNQTFSSLKEVKLELAAFVESYNNDRIHESLGYKTPREMYEELTLAA